MKIFEIEELKEVFRRIIEKLENEKVKDINFQDDLYRKIPTHKWDSFEENIDIYNCSLYDDIDYLKKMASSKDSICTYVDFDRTASVLRAISQIRNPV